MELDGYLRFVSVSPMSAVKIVLGVLAIIGFGIEGIMAIQSALQYWPADGAPDKELRMHIIDYFGILAGCAGGICVAIAVCLGGKTKQEPPRVNKVVTTDGSR